MCKCRPRTPRFLKTPLISAKKLPEPAKGQPTFHKCPAPQPFPEKVTTERNPRCFSTFRYHRPGCAKPWPLDESSGPVPRQSDDAGPIVISRSPNGLIWVWGGAGSEGRPEHPSQAGLFQKAPGDSHVRPGNANPGSTSFTSKNQRGA